MEAFMDFTRKQLLPRKFMFYINRSFYYRASGSVLPTFFGLRRSVIMSSIIVPIAIHYKRVCPRKQIPTS